MTRSIAPLILALALAGCGKAADKSTGGTADGEILPGSASDAMLPLDSVRSQPPLAPKAAPSDKATGAAKGATANASEVAPATNGAQTEATATPAKESSPAPDGVTQ